MRKLEIKHPEYGKFGRLSKYDDRHLMSDESLPNRVDFHPAVTPTGKETPAQDDRIYKKSLEILDKIFVDGDPLTSLYDFNIYSSGFNPHGYGVPHWNYYIVGKLKKPSITSKELKEMVMEAVISVMNHRL